jgi:hypothetical protein
MMFRSFVALLTLGAAALTTGAADDENPFKNAKVGDYAKYTIKGKLGFLPLDGIVTQTVTERSDKEATLKIVLTAGGADTPFPDQKIDLTKPLDPSKGIALPGFGDAKLEKLKDGKEKVKVGNKEYDAEWLTFKVKVANKGIESEGDLKVWVAREVPVPFVKMNVTITVNKNDVKLAMELTEVGTGAKK